MFTVVTLAGSPSRRSASTALLAFLAGRLSRQNIRVQHIGVRDLPSDDLMAARQNSQGARIFATRLALADALVLSTPVCKASFSGGLKAMLDLLPERALEGKVILPVATAASERQFAALDASLQPVLDALGAPQILPSVCVEESQVRLSSDGVAHDQIDLAVQHQLEVAARTLAVCLQEREIQHHIIARPLTPPVEQGRCCL